MAHRLLAFDDLDPLKQFGPVSRAQPRPHHVRTVSHHGAEPLDRHLPGAEVIHLRSASVPEERSVFAARQSLPGQFLVLGIVAVAEPMCCPLAGFRKHHGIRFRLYPVPTSTAHTRKSALKGRQAKVRTSFPGSSRLSLSRSAAQWRRARRPALNSSAPATLRRSRNVNLVG